MALESPSIGRITIDESAEGVRAIIPSRKNWFVILFLGFWLCGWAMGEVTVLRAFLSGLLGTTDMPGFAMVFMTFWLCGWTIGGAIALIIFLWTLEGEERILMSNNVLTVERAIPMWVRRWQYDLSEMSAMRSVETGQTGLFSGSKAFQGRRQVSFLVDVRQGAIQFEYGRSMRAFGLDLDAVEARDILEALERAS